MGDWMAEARQERDEPCVSPWLLPKDRPLHAIRSIAQWSFQQQYAMGNYGKWPFTAVFSIEIGDSLCFSHGLSVVSPLNMVMSHISVSLPEGILSDSSKLIKVNTMTINNDNSQHNHNDSKHDIKNDNQSTH